MEPDWVVERAGLTRFQNATRLKALEAQKEHRLFPVGFQTGNRRGTRVGIIAKLLGTSYSYKYEGELEGGLPSTDLYSSLFMRRCFGYIGLDAWGGACRRCGRPSTLAFALDGGSSRSGAANTWRRPAERRRALVHRAACGWAPFARGRCWAQASGLHTWAAMRSQAPGELGRPPGRAGPDMSQPPFVPVVPYVHGDLSAQLSNAPHRRGLGRAPCV